MPGEIEIIEGIIHTKLTGELNFDAILAHLNELLELEGQVDDHYEFMDLAEVESINLSSEDITQFSKIGKQVGDTYNKSILAIYAPSNLAFGIGRMFEIISESIHVTQVEVFRKRDDALEFLSKVKLANQ